MSEITSIQDLEASLQQSIAFDTDPFRRGLDDLCGLADEITMLRQLFVGGLAPPDAAVRGPSLLVHGPEGAGQSRVARAVVTELATHDFECVHLSTAALTDRDAHRQHRADYALAQLIEHLEDHTPVTLLLEEFEQMQFSGDRHFHEAVADLRDQTHRVAVVCVLSRSDPHFRPGNMPEHFEFADFTVQLDSPSATRRACILAETLQKCTLGTSVGVDADCDRALNRADERSDVPVTALRDIARRAILIAQAGSASPPASQSSSQSTSTQPSPTVTTDDVVRAIEQITDEQPTSQSPPHRDASISELFQPHVPAVTFDEVGGLNATIQQLRELVTYPQAYEHVYAETPVSPATGVLLHGPPGTGKTLLAKALATETDRTFFAVEGAAIKSKWFGQSEARVRRLFETAREKAPSIVFFDEFDAVAPKRRETGHSTVQSIVNTLLAELDGISANEEVLVVAATNYPDALDPAVRRAGRLGASLEVPPPDVEGRREIFRIHASGLPTGPAVDPEWVADSTPAGTTGAEIAAIVKRALRRALRRHDDDTGDTPVVSRGDIMAAIESVCEVSAAGPPRGYQ